MDKNQPVRQEENYLQMKDYTENLPSIKTALVDYIKSNVDKATKCNLSDPKYLQWVQENNIYAV